MSLWLAKKQKSNEVAALQNALNIALRKEKPLVIDGDFGNHTEQTVRHFQKWKHLTVDGIAGPRTLSHLFRHVEVTSTFRADTTGRGREAVSSIGPYDYDLRPRQSGASAVSLGLADVYYRESLMRSWINQSPPKQPLTLPDVKLHLPPFEYRLRPPSFDVPHLTPGRPLRPILRPSIPRSLFPTRLLLLDLRETSTGSMEAAPGTGVVFDAEMETEVDVSKEVTEVEMVFRYPALVVIGDELVEISPTTFSDRFGLWRFRAEVGIRPFKFTSDLKWHDWTLEASPLIRGSYTAPNFLGVDAKGSFSVGGDIKISGPVGRRGLWLSIGGRFGARFGMELGPDHVEGFAVRPEAAFGLNIAIRCCRRGRS